MQITTCTSDFIQKLGGTFQQLLESMSKTELCWSLISADMMLWSLQSIEFYITICLPRVYKCETLDILGIRHLSNIESMRLQ